MIDRAMRQYQAQVAKSAYEKTDIEIIADLPPGKYQVEIVGPQHQSLVEAIIHGLRDLMMDVKDPASVQTAIEAVRRIK